jgi:hypothetical protein
MTGEARRAVKNIHTNADIAVAIAATSAATSRAVFAEVPAASPPGAQVYI